MESVEKDTKPENEDLSKLLDSCLDDFNKPVSKPASSNSPIDKLVSSLDMASAASSSTNIPDASVWTDEFKEFNKMMETYMDDQGEINDIKKWMESIAGGQNPLENDEDFAKTFTDTLRELSEQAQNVPDSNPEELANLLGNLDLGDQNISNQMSDVMPLMQNVMQKLMSKELLYPSIKEISEKYPDWLRENKAKLTTEDYDNFQKQYELMVKVCEEFEKKSVDCETSNKEQFENVLQLMQKIQNYGNPPKELVSNVGSNLPLDEQGNFQIPGMPQQCSIM